MTPMQHTLTRPVMPKRGGGGGQPGSRWMPGGHVLLIITRPEIPLAPYRGWPGRYPRHMTDQGRGLPPAGRGPRHALGADSGPQPSLGPGSGAQQVLESDSGPQQAVGPTGPLRSLHSADPGSSHPLDPASATGAMGAMGPTGPLPRTPVRRFPPGRVASQPAPQAPLA